MCSGPRILVGGAALLLSTGALFALAARGTGPVPLRPAREEVRLSIGRHGWRPSTVATHKGARLRLIVSADEGERCFAIDEFRVEKRIVAGRETRIDIVPDRAGSFAFYDCLASEGRRATGKMVVAD